MDDDSDIAWEKKCREEDMKYREILNSRRRADETRRKIDEKAQQLECIASLSALLGGFSTGMMVEPGFPQDASPVVTVLFGGCCTIGVGFLYLAMINCSYMLVGILKFDCTNEDIMFNDFWRKRCENDWKLSFKAFTLGVPLCLISLALLLWMILKDFFWACVIGSSFVGITLVIFFQRLSKWGNFLVNSTPLTAN